MAEKENQSISLQGASIVSFSLEQWGHVWRSRHQIMSRFAKSNKVMFSSKPIYVRDVFNKPGDAESGSTGLSRLSDNLHTYIPPRWLPASHGYPRINRLLHALRCWKARLEMRSLNMKRPILYIWYPSFVDMIGHFGESLVVYHVYDEYLSFRMKDSEKADLAAQEKELLKRADIVFAASEELAARRRPFNSNVHVVENAVDYGLFATAVSPNTTIPDDLVRIGSPIVACVATAATFMNLALLHEIFKRRPDWSLVFIGVDVTPDEQAGEVQKTLQALPNVHYLGLRPLQALPGYLKGCDVCAIPYAMEDAVMVCSSPLKLYEYLAAGKPVVSTPLPLMSHLENVVAFAADADEWIAAIEFALQGNGKGTVAERQRIAGENTWDQRVAFISQKVASTLAHRQRPE